MAIDITTNFVATVAGGPSLGRSFKLAVDAFDLIDVSIADGAADEAVEVQPGGAGQVQFLLVLADSYDPALSYKVNAAGNPSHDLDRELLLAGEGALGLLDDAPNELLFTNATGQAISVRVLIGRNAT
jgi:hypothetical protein